MPNETPRHRFEPPPWEREAFERFERERAERQAKEDLEAALRLVREPSAAPEQQQAPTTTVVDATPEQDAGLSSEVGSEAVEPPPASGSVVPGPPPVKPTIPTSEIDAMLIQLALEEPKNPRANPVFINAVVGFLAAAGLFIVVQAALLFGQTRSSEAAGTMLAATVSLVVLFAGLGFLGGAALLFRKYHR